ncbi:MAG TPA: hypothetical protein VK151_09335 [Fluviicola sp.]|nr:hypothetical protein [Fluviicola sp.]
MKRLLPTLLSLLLGVFSEVYSQEYPNLVSPTKVTTIGYWYNGQSTDYHVKETHASYKGKSEKPFKSTTSEYDIQLKVTDSTATSYEFEMEYTNYVPDAEAQQFIRKMAELQNNLPIRYRTNELGQFDTILNLEELQQQLIGKLELCVTYIEEEEDEMKEIYKMVISNMSEQFKQLESIEALFLTDILMIHGFYGLEMQQGKPLDIELNYPTIGDIVLTGTGKVNLNAINKSKDECTFSTTEKPDRDELSQYMGSLALLFMMDSGKKISMEELSISMNTRKKMKMELSSGWMNSVEQTTTTKLTNKKGDQKKVTTQTYTRN